MNLIILITWSLSGALFLMAALRYGTKQLTWNSFTFCIAFGCIFGYVAALIGIVGLLSTFLKIHGDKKIF